MPRKNSAKQPIGMGKAGSGKRLIAQAGGGKKALKTWRSLAKPTRQTIKASAQAGNYDLKGTLKNIRAGRVAAGAGPVSGRISKKNVRANAAKKAAAQGQLQRQRMNQGNMRSSIQNIVQRAARG